MDFIELVDTIINIDDIVYVHLEKDLYLLIVFRNGKQIQYDSLDYDVNVLYNRLASKIANKMKLGGK